MTRNLILIVSSDDRRLQTWRHVVHGAGHWSLPADTVERAFSLIRKVRPVLVVADAQLTDGRAHTLLREMRAIEPLRQVWVIVLGGILAAEHDYVAADPYAAVRQIDDDEDGLVALLDEMLGGSRLTPQPVPAPWAKGDPCNAGAVFAHEVLHDRTWPAGPPADTA